MPICDNQSRAAACASYAIKAKDECGADPTVFSPTVTLSGGDVSTVYHKGASVSLVAKAEDKNKDLVSADILVGGISKAPMTSGGTRWLSPAVSYSFTKELDCVTINAVAEDASGRKGTDHMNLTVGDAKACDGDYLKTIVQALSPSDPNYKHPYWEPILFKVYAKAPGKETISKIDFVLTWVEGTVPKRTVLKTFTPNESSNTSEYTWQPTKADVQNYTLRYEVTFSGTPDTPVPATSSLLVVADVGSSKPPAWAGLPAEAEALGRMYSVTVTVPDKLGDVPITMASIRSLSDGKYCGLLSADGKDLCKVYDSEEDLVSPAELANYKNPTGEDFLILKGATARSFQIFGIASKAAYALGSQLLEIKVDNGIPYKVAVNFKKNTETAPGVFDDSKKLITKDEMFNSLIDMAYSALTHPIKPPKDIPVPAVVLNKRAATAALDLTDFLAVKALTYAFIGGKVMTASVLNFAIGMERGLVDGIFKGIDNDLNGVNQIIDFLYYPECRFAEMRNTYKAIVANIGSDPKGAYDKLGDAVNAAIFPLFTFEDRKILWNVKDMDGAAVDLGLRGYALGFMAGYSIECVIVTLGPGGVVTALESGEFLKTALRLTKESFDVVTPIVRLTKKFVYFGSQTIKYGKTFSVGQMQKNIDEMFSVMKTLETTALIGDPNGKHVLEHLAEVYPGDWGKKVEALAIASEGEWLKRVQPVLIAAARINAANHLNLPDDVIEGIFRLYPPLVDLEEIFPGLLEVILKSFGPTRPAIDLTQLSEIMAKVPLGRAKAVITETNSILPGSATIKGNMYRIYSFGVTPDGVHWSSAYEVNPNGHYRGTRPNTYKDCYVGDHPSTSWYEVRGPENADKAMFGKGMYGVEITMDKVLNLDGAKVPADFVFDRATFIRKYESFIASKGSEDAARKFVYDYCNPIIDKARARGYNGVWFPSAQISEGLNMQLFEGKFDHTNPAQWKEFFHIKGI